VDLAETVEEFLADVSGRAVERTDTLPEDLPVGTWVWFTSADYTGAAVVMPGGRYGLYVPGVRDLGVRSDRRVRSMMGDTPYTFVIAWPDVPADPDDLSGVPPTGQDELYLYKEEDGDYSVASRVEDEDVQPLGRLAEYYPVAWLLNNAPMHGITVEDVFNGLEDAVSFFRDTGRAEGGDLPTVVEAVFTAIANVQRTDTLPQRLPEGTWIWFTGAQRTGAMIILPGGQYGVYVPGTHLGIAGARRVPSVIGDGPHTFVIAHHGSTAIAPAEVTQASEVRPDHAPESSVHHGEPPPRGESDRWTTRLRPLPNVRVRTRPPPLTTGRRSVRPQTSLAPRPV
jgi:hypothetical protein